jgi:ABC-type tungstate transport system permease subunit
LNNTVDTCDYSPRENNTLTFEIDAEIDGKNHNFVITVPSEVKDINRSQAARIVRVLMPNAGEIIIGVCMCQY